MALTANYREPETGLDRPATGLDRHFDLPVIRQVGAGRPFHWLARGWDDLTRAPTASFAHGLVFALLGLLVLQLARSSPYLFPSAVFGFLLVGPLVAAGLYEISRRHETGATVGFGDSLRAWRRNGGAMGLYAAMMGLTAIAWERMSAIVFALLYGGTAPGLPTFLSDVFLSGNYLALAAAWMLIGAAMAVVVFSVSAIAAPMLVDRDVDAATAMATSVKAIGTNPAAKLVWAALIVALVAVGFATMLVGMVVLLPLLGHATWHAYRDLVES
ncbi:MAG: DUF2189 domain-containing protein [Limnobacter sp.]|nr:DUF2189 domain-containing protein [Limnobacter sp.]